MAENQALSPGGRNEGSVFDRPRRPFRLLNREFNLQFIPSIHFQEIFRQVLEIMLSLDVAGAELALRPGDAVAGNAGQNVVFARLRTLLEEKAYVLLHDVLLYQNNERVDMESLKYRTSPLEVAEFLNLLLTDDEVWRALEVVTGGLGKLMRRLNPEPDSPAADSPTMNSTPFS